MYLFYSEIEVLPAIATRDDKKFNEVMDYELSLDDINAIERGDAILLDVRKTEELLLKEYRGSIHWDPQAILRGRLPDFPKEKKIYVFCERGNDAQLAMAAFYSAGFKDVFSLGAIDRLPERFSVTANPVQTNLIPHREKVIKPLKHSKQPKHQ